MAEGVQLESLGTFTRLRRLHVPSFSVAGEDSKLRKIHFQMLSYIDLFSERSLVQQETQEDMVHWETQEKHSALRNT